MNELPIIAKLHEQVGTGHFYDDGYASVVGGKVESRPATEMTRSANRDGSEAAAIIEELYAALDAVVVNLTEGDFISETRLSLARAALRKARGEQVRSDPLPKEVGR